MLRISDITGLFFVFSNLRTEPVAMFHLKNLREKRERARGCKDLPYSLYLEPATALFFMQADSRRCLRINNGRRFMHTELHLHRTSGTCDTLQGLSPMSDVLLSYGLKGDVGASPHTGDTPPQSGEKRKKFPPAHVYLHVQIPRYMAKTYEQHLYKSYKYKIGFFVLRFRDGYDIIVLFVSLNSGPAV